MDFEIAGCDELSVGNSSRKALTHDLYGTSDSAITAGGDRNDPEWDTYSQPAGMDAKPSWGFGGEAPDEAALGAAALTSLDEIKNNRNSGRTVPDYYRRPRNRGRFCGKEFAVGASILPQGRRVVPANQLRLVDVLLLRPAKG